MTEKITLVKDTIDVNKLLSMYEELERLKALKN